ncbi:MAG: hypothetical protein A2231_03140, partial [Candidatus Firestonebacteria bacterium RIFOXYA2_FULL_40_8]
PTWNRTWCDECCQPINPADFVIKKKCIHCGAVFDDNANKKYCSAKCYLAHRKTIVENNGYPDHYLFKKNRIAKLSNASFVCEICNLNKATVVHHIDKSKTNHALENLMAICTGCHAQVHINQWGRPRKYPKSLNDMQKNTGLSMPTLIKYYKNKNSVTARVKNKIEIFLKGT